MFSKCETSLNLFVCMKHHSLLYQLFVCVLGNYDAQFEFW